MLSQICDNVHNIKTQGITMGDLNFWKEHIADMPEFSDGQWVDLETGLAYDDNYSANTKKARFQADDQTKKYRAAAKLLGGQALKGTPKQKKWAEKIRADYLAASLSDEDKKAVLKCANFINHSKFWIENRDMGWTHLTFSNISKEYKALLALRDKHYDTLARSGERSKQEAAKKEILEQVKANKLKLYVDFPNFDINSRGNC